MQEQLCPASTMPVCYWRFASFVSLAGLLALMQPGRKSWLHWDRLCWSRLLIPDRSRGHRTQEKSHSSTCVYLVRKSQFKDIGWQEHSLPSCSSCHSFLVCLTCPSKASSLLYCIFKFKNNSRPIDITLCTLLLMLILLLLIIQL